MVEWSSNKVRGLVLVAQNGETKIREFGAGCAVEETPRIFDTAARRLFAPRLVISSLT